MRDECRESCLAFFDRRERVSLVKDAAARAHLWRGRLGSVVHGVGRDVHVGWTGGHVDSFRDLGARQPAKRALVASGTLDNH